MDIAEKKLLSRRFYEEYDRNDREALARMLAPSCVVHLPGSAAPLSREAFLQISNLFAGAFSDSKTRFLDQIVEDDTAVTRWVWSITHSGEFMGIPATGRRIAIEGVTINKFAGRAIVEQWVSFDQLAVLEQLGGLP
jgi:predicted ester cyclase